MKNRLPSFAVLIVALAAFTALGFAQQNKSQRPSPPASAHFTFPDGKTLTIDYSSPRMRGREIFGGLVPYGKVWRAGANEATTFVTDTDLRVGDKTVPAGAYTLDTIPEPGKWTLIVSRKTKNDKGGSGLGHSLSRRTVRLRPHSHGSLEARQSRRRFHHFARPRRRWLLAEYGLGDHPRHDPNHREKIAPLVSVLLSSRTQSAAVAGCWWGSAVAFALVAVPGLAASAKLCVPQLSLSSRTRSPAFG